MRQSPQVLEWQQEARVETMQGVLLDALRLRFQAPVPDDLATTIAQSSDLGQLSRWFQISQTASSLDAFRSAIQNGGTGQPPTGPS